VQALLLIVVFIILFNVFFGGDNTKERETSVTRHQVKVSISQKEEKTHKNEYDGEISLQEDTEDIKEEHFSKYSGKESQTYRNFRREIRKDLPESNSYSITRGIKVVPKIYNTQITNSSQHSNSVEVEKVKLFGNFILFKDKEGIHLWNLEERKEVFSVNSCDSDNIRDFHASLSGDLLVIGCGRVVKVWNIRYGKLIIEKELENINSVAICGNNLLVASEGDLELYEVSDGKLRKVSSVETGEISSIDCLSEKKAAVYKDETVDIWKILSEKEAFQENILAGDIIADIERRRFFFIKNLRFEGRKVLAIGDGKAVLLNEEGKVEFWDLDSEGKESLLNEIPDGIEIVDADFYRGKLITVDGSLRIRVFSLENRINEVESFSLLNSVEGTLTAQQKTPRKSPRYWYKHQYALVVGINDYDQDPLNSAVADAKAVKRELERRGFKVRFLYNERATKENILKVLDEIRKNINEEDSFVFYFSGHGASLKTSAGVERGFIIPYGAEISLNSSIIEYDKKTISLHFLRDIAYDMKAKHVAFFLDSCFSGLIFEKRGRKSIPQIEMLLQRKAIDILTAGGNQEVYDGGSEHSPFTTALLEALHGNADYNRDGYLTFPEIANYVRKRVLELTANRNQQKPQFDNLVDANEKGEFVFEVITNF